MRACRRTSLPHDAPPEVLKLSAGVAPATAAECSVAPPPVAPLTYTAEAPTSVNAVRVAPRE